MTQADLARLTGLAEATVNRHLIVDQTPAAKKLQRCPTVALLLRYSDALNVPVEDLLGRPQRSALGRSGHTAVLHRGLPSPELRVAHLVPRHSGHDTPVRCRGRAAAVRRQEQGALVPALADAQMPPGQFLTDWYSLPRKERLPPRDLPNGKVFDGSEFGSLSSGSNPGSAAPAGPPAVPVASPRHQLRSLSAHGSRMDKGFRPGPATKVAEEAQQDVEPSLVTIPEGALSHHLYLVTWVVGSQ